MANDRLRDALFRRGMSPEALAQHVGVDPKTAERWITLGRIPYPKNRHEIAALVKESESYLWPDALTTEQTTRVAAAEVVSLYPHRASIPQELWSHLLTDATERVDVLVYAALFLPEQNPSIAKTLRVKARAGTKVRLLFGDPASREVAQRSTEEGIGRTAIATKIRNTLVHFSPLRNAAGVDVRFHRTTLYNSLYRFDDDMLVNTHIYGFGAAHAPVLHLRRLSGGDLFESYADSFERVWLASKPATW